MVRVVDSGHHQIAAESSTFVMVPLVASAVEEATKTPNIINLDTHGGSITYLRLSLERGFFNMSVKASIVPTSEAIVEMKDTNLVR